MLRGNNNASISVIIPAWQACDFMKRCLESIKYQNQKPSSVMIGVDACEKTLEASTKAVARCIKGIGKVYWFPNHVGPYLIRNTLAKLSRSEILLFFDADDQMCSNYVEKMGLIASDGKYARARQKIFYDGVRDRRAMKEEAMFGMEQGCGLKRDIFMSMKGYPPWMCKADTAFLRLCLANGIRKQTTEDIVLIRNKHDNCLTLRKDTGYLSTLRKKYTKEGQKLLKSSTPREFETAYCERIL